MAAIGADSIFNKHYNNLHHEYEDGFVGPAGQPDIDNYRNGRIDYIWISGAAIDASSFDLSCGEGETQTEPFPRKRNCKQTRDQEDMEASEEWYAEGHRVVWAIFR